MARRPWPIDLSGWEQFCFRVASNVSSVPCYGHCILCIILWSLYFGVLCYGTHCINVYHVPGQVPNSLCTQVDREPDCFRAVSTVSWISYFGHCIFCIIPLAVTVSFAFTVPCTWLGCPTDLVHKWIGNLTIH